MIPVKNRKSQSSLFFDPFFMGPNTKMVNPEVLRKSIHTKIYSNILETENGFEIELAAPGFNKKDLTIGLEKNKLKIALKKDVKGEDEIKYVRQEFNFNSFTKIFNVPNDINIDKIEASYELGVLKITLPKLAPIIKKIAVL